ELDRLLAERDTDDRPTEAELDQLGAEALHRLVTAGGDGQARYEAHVLIDYQTLLGDLALHGICELSDGTPIPPSTARRLACQAAISPALMGTHGEVLDLGREVRLATRAQRRALRAMYRGCVFPGCRVPFDRCEIHHPHPFELGGPTDLDDLVPACW